MHIVHASIYTHTVYHQPVNHSESFFIICSLKIMHTQTHTHTSAAVTHYKVVTRQHLIAIIGRLYKPPVWTPVSNEFLSWLQIVRTASRHLVCAYMWAYVCFHVWASDWNLHPPSPSTTHLWLSSLRLPSLPPWRLTQNNLGSKKANVHLLYVSSVPAAKLRLYPHDQWFLFIIWNEIK